MNTPGGRLYCDVIRKERLDRVKNYNWQSYRSIYLRVECCVIFII